MNSIDKNDVDISKLFNWGKKVKIVDKNGKLVLELFIRLVNDSELNQARVGALRASRELRQKLNDKSSPERLAFIPDFEMIGDENLVEALLVNELRTITQDVVRNLDFNLPVEPASTAPLEEQEKYQAKIDSWPEKRNKEIEEKVLARVASERKRLKALKRSELEKSFEKSLIESYCEDLMQETFIHMCAYFGTYLEDDYKDRAFESYEQFKTLLPEFMKQLVESYNTLDLSLDTLKK
jgi:hypothetical protein